MDLPLGDLSDDQDSLKPFECNYVEDVWLCGNYSDYWLDVIEEDALNEKYCIQVLRILIDKADEEIMNLEEDILMLQCQLAWDDENWSKPCSIDLREKINHLDVLMQSLKKGITEGVHDFRNLLEQTEKLPQKLHDLLRPLLENYLAKSMQTESGITQMSDLPAAGLCKKKLATSTSEHNKNVEAKKRTNMLTKNQTKNPSMELEERMINQPQKGRRISVSAPMESGRSPIKSEPSYALVEDSSACISTEKACSRERDERGNTDTDAISKAKVTTSRLAHESRVINSNLESRETENVKPADDVVLGSQLDCSKQITEASSEIGKARAYRDAIDKNIYSTKSLVKIEPGTELWEITEAMEAQEIDIGSSSIVNLKAKQGFGVSEKIIMNGENNGASEVRTTSISSPQEKRKLSHSPITERKGVGLLKLAKVEYDEKATDKCGLENKSKCIRDVKGLTLKDLKTIAKNQKLRGYSRLRKEELRKYLGLVP